MKEWYEGYNLYDPSVKLDTITNKMIETKGNEMLVIAMEELSELIQAISKLKRGKPNIDNMAEEIADTLICIEIIKKIGNVSEDAIQDWVDFKLTRSLSKIEEGTFN